MTKNYLGSALLSYARANEEAPFATLADGSVVTNADLLQLSGKFANALLAFGVKPGDRVAVQVEKSFSALALYLATIRSGAIFLPLNTAYTAAEIEYFLGDAAPALFICDTASKEAYLPIAEATGTELATLDASGQRGSFFEQASPCSAIFEDQSRTADDLVAILYTSGTTGRSKGAMITGHNLLSNAEALVEAWRIQSSDILLHALPIFHAHGLFVGINTILVAGAKLIFLPKFDGDQVIGLLPRATMFMGVPTFYTRLLQHEALRESARNIRLFVSGSAPLLDETHRQFSAITGHAILERYGMTETGMNTSNPYDSERRPGSVGFPLPGVEIRIADDAGPVKDGEIGVIEIRGPNVFKGYWQMPEKTASEFRADGFFISGDLAKRDADGYIHIVGRAKDLVISGGYNVYPKEVESEVDEIDGVVESAVIGIPHPDFGEAVTAVIVLENGANLSVEEIRAHLKTRLATYKQPKKLIIVDELPRNTMGKVQKAELRARYGDQFKA